jgi:hypothetical protein
VVALDGPAGARLSVHKFTSANHWALSGNAWAGSAVALQFQALGSVWVSLMHHLCVGGRVAADAPEVPPGHRRFSLRRL